MKNKVKIFAISAFFFLSLMTVSVSAQTTLVAGDIAFSGYISNNTPNNEI